MECKILENNQSFNGLYKIKYVKNGKPFTTLFLYKHKHTACLSEQSCTKFLVGKCFLDITLRPCGWWKKLPKLDAFISGIGKTQSEVKLEESEKASKDQRGKAKVKEFPKFPILLLLKSLLSNI